jgi:hypothetical protein
MSSTKTNKPPAAVASTAAGVADGDDSQQPHESLIARHPIVFVIVMAVLAVSALVLLVLFLGASSQSEKLTKQNATLTTQNATLTTQNTYATTQNTSLATQVQNATAAASAQAAQIDTLNTQLTVQQTSYNGIIASLEKSRLINTFISGIYSVPVTSWNGGYHTLTVVLSYVDAQLGSSNMPCIYMACYMPPTAGSATAPAVPTPSNDLMLLQGGSTYNTSHLWFENAMTLNADWAGDDDNVRVFSVQSDDGAYKLSSTDGSTIKFTGTISVTSTNASGTTTVPLALVAAPLIRLA